MLVCEEPGLATLEMDAMAKKKEESKTLFSVKGVPSWFEWVKELADSEGMDVMGFMDHAFKEFARGKDFPKPMPKRTPKR